MAARLDAPTLRRAMVLLAESLRGHRDELNSLNVYPVPDADTGTNLLLTQEAVERALAWSAEGNELAGLCQTIARPSLMGARGNSGVILSQTLRGLCQVLPTDGSGAVINEVGRGDVVGEMALLTDSPRSATIVALPPPK